MNDIETKKEFHFKLLLEIEALFKEHYGKGYNTRLSVAETRYTLCTDNFILTFFFDDMHFFLTFMVGQSAKKVALDVKLLMLILDYTEFTMMEDSFFDKESNELVFGFDAIEAKQKEYLKDTGKTKCPICERIFPNEVFIKSGICKFCDTSKDKISWN